MDDEIEELAKRTEKYKQMNLQHQQFLARYSQIVDEPEQLEEMSSPKQTYSRNLHRTTGRAAQNSQTHGSSAAESIDAICRKYQNVMSGSQVKINDTRVQQAIDSLNELKRELLGDDQIPQPALPVMSVRRNHNASLGEFAQKTQLETPDLTSINMDTNEVGFLGQKSSLTSKPNTETYYNTRTSRPEASNGRSIQMNDSQKPSSNPTVNNKMILRKPLKLAILKEHYRHRKMNEPIMCHEDSPDSSTPRQQLQAAPQKIPTEQRQDIDIKLGTEERSPSPEPTEKNEVEPESVIEQTSQLFEIEDEKPPQKEPSDQLAEEQNHDRWHNTLLTYSRDDEAASRISRHTDPRDSLPVDRSIPQCIEEVSRSEHSLHQQSSRSEEQADQEEQHPHEYPHEPADHSHRIDEPQQEINDPQIDTTPALEEHGIEEADSTVLDNHSASSQTDLPVQHPQTNPLDEYRTADHEELEAHVPQPSADIDLQDIASIQCVLQTLRDLAAQEEDPPQELPEQQTHPCVAISPAAADMTIEHQEKQVSPLHDRIDKMKRRLVELEDILFRQVWRF